MFPHACAESAHARRGALPQATMKIIWGSRNLLPPQASSNREASLSATPQTSILLLRFLAAVMAKDVEVAFRLFAAEIF